MKGRGTALSLGVLGVCSLILFRDGLLGNAVFYERDTFLFYEPLTRWFAASLREGHIPLWIPLIFSGYPLFADGEIGMLYPPNLLLVPLLSDGIRLAALRALHVFLAGAFMLAFLGELGVGRWGALVGGLVFAFGSFLITQIHHENLVRSAIWLPLVLLFTERGLSRVGWARQRYYVAAGIALALAALGLHVQPVAMATMVVSFYVMYRVLVGPVSGSPWERPLQLFWAPAVVLGLGAAGSAVQWVPLLELGRASYRGPGLAYDLATTWPLRWQNLVTVFFPYLFRMEDGRYVMLWQQWESFLYVGMAPLLLAFLALLVVRHRLVPFFVLLGLFGLAVGLADQSPVNLHRVLWSLPGLSSLRAPGRFAYLIVFSLAALAAFGMAWLARRERPRWPGVAAGLCGLLLAVGLAWLLAALRSRLVADPVRWLALIDQHYMATRHEHPWLTGRMVYDQLVVSLDLQHPKTALTLALLVSASMLVIGAALRPRRFWAAGAALIALTALDLLVFDYDFHPRAPLDQLLQPDPIARYLAEHANGARVFAESEVRALEPNRPLFAGLSSVSGYSSLQSQRHFEYWTNVDRQQDALLDLWGVEYVVLVDPPTDVVIVDGTAYRPYSPLFNGTARNRTGFSVFSVAPFVARELRVLSMLIDGVDVPQGTPVAEITLVSSDGRRETVALRAGVDTAENAYDRPDVRPRVRHALAPLAGQVPDIAPTGEPASANLYRSSFPLEPLEVVRVEVSQIGLQGQTRIFGIGLVSPSGQVRSLFNANRAKLSEEFRADGVAVFRNAAAYPRAYLVPEAIARRSRQELSALPRLARHPFDPARTVILEEGPFTEFPVLDSPAAANPQPGDLPMAGDVVDRSTEHVQVRLPEHQGGFLVLADAYHRGWRASVDGRPAHVYLANFLWRAVRVEPGDRTVDFVFDPLSLRIGRALTIATLGFAAAVIMVPVLWTRSLAFRWAARPFRANGASRTDARGD